MKYIVKESKTIGTVDRYRNSWRSEKRSKILKPAYVFPQTEIDWRKFRYKSQKRRIVRCECGSCQ